MAKSDDGASMRHPIWNDYLAPDIAQLTKKRLKTVPNNVRPDPLQFVITSILLSGIPLRTRVRAFNFIRRTRIAFEEYALARKSYAKYFIARNPVFYLSALHHFESYLGAAYQGHELLFGINGNDFFDPKAKGGRRELNARMSRLYNSAKHTEGSIKKASFVGDTLAMWITNTGLQTRSDHMKFAELHEILADMSLAASIMAKSYIWRGEPVPPFWQQKPHVKRATSRAGGNCGRSAKAQEPVIARR